MFDFLKKKLEPRPESKQPELSFLVASKDEQLANMYNPREHLDQYQKSKNGLYPDEILMLSMAGRYKVKENHFPGFWGNLYCVTNPQEMLESLEKRGFIKVGGLRETLLACATGKELKELLAEQNLKLTGKKEEMADRLVSSPDVGRLEIKYENRVYVLTALGEEELKDNEYVTYLHDNCHCATGIWEMNHMLYFENPKHLKYRDLIWQKYVYDSLKQFKEGQFGLYRNTHQYMYELLMDEERYKDAFREMSEVMCCDFSGLCLSHIGITYGEDKKYFYGMLLKHSFPYTSADKGQSLTSIAPVWVRNMLKLKEKLGMTDDEFHTALLENFKNAVGRLPFHLFMPDEIAKICVLMIDGNTDEINLIYEVSRQRVEKLYKACK